MKSAVHTFDNDNRGVDQRSVTTHAPEASVPIVSLPDDPAREILRELYQHIEEFAAAYLKHTGLPPDQVVLCQRVASDGTWSYWFETKEENDARR